MTGKFLKRGAIIDLIRSSDRTNAIRKRDGLQQHPVRTVVCGCPDDNCGGWHSIETDRSIPTDEEIHRELQLRNQAKKAKKRSRAHRVS